MLLPSVRDYLDKLEKDQNPLASYHGEFDIAKEIKNILSADKEYKQTKEDMAEQMAFDFMADYSNDNSGWNTYHGPMFVLPNEQGQMVEYPSIKRVDSEILEYWSKRAKECSNPILSARYADLVVDFSPKVINKSAENEQFQIVIDSNIEICRKKLAESLDCKTKIKRALELAIYKHDEQRISKVKNSILELEEQIAIEDKPGLWGFAFKWLVLDHSDKVNLDDTEKTKLISELEARLLRIEHNPWLAENAVSLLAEYYASQKNEKDLMRVLGIFENSLKSDKRSNEDALQKTHSYEEIQQIYRKYANRFPEANKASNRLLQEIGKLNLDWNKSLQEISVETRIPREEIDKYLQSIFGENINDDLELVIAKIVVSHLPKHDAIQKQFDEVYSRSITNIIATQHILSDDHIPVAKLSSVTDNLDSHIKRNALQYVQFGSFFLSLTMDELKVKFNKNDIINYLEKSVVFENENKEYLERAISAYWDNDYLLASHLLNPLIESGVRELMKIADGVWINVNGLDGYDKLTLSKLLHNKQNAEIFKNIFSNSGEDLLFYIKLVLTEKLGMNLRNDFAHGLAKQKFFGRDASDRLFHILLWLSVVKKKAKKVLP